MRLAQLTAALLTISSSFAASFRAGTARADITPAGGELMWGYESRMEPAKGTLDPLFARVLVLEAGGKRLALVTLDLGRSFGPASLKRLRDSAQRSSGISCLLVAASHTHSAPVIRDAYEHGAPEWERTALEKIETAIAQATEQLQEARIGAGTGMAYIGHNRLRLNPDGSTSWFERNRTRIPTSPIDPSVSVIRIDRADGSPVAVLTNHACHPVVFGPDNMRYSADFPGVMNRVVEERLGTRTLSMFLQGAPGDINPYYAVTPLDQDAIKWRDWTGDRLGREAARVAAEIHTREVENPELDFAEESLTVRLRWDAEKFRAGLLKFLGPKGMDVYGAVITPEFQLPVTTVLINRQIALTTMPGEPFVEFQMTWRDRVRCQRRFCSATRTDTTVTFQQSPRRQTAATARQARAHGRNRAPASEWSIVRW